MDILTSKSVQGSLNLKEFSLKKKNQAMDGIYKDMKMINNMKSRKFIFNY